MSGWLEGKVALITGGGNGIGRAVVDRFVAEGAKCTVFSLSRPPLDRIVEAYGDKVAVFSGNVKNQEDNQAAVDLAIKTFGKIDVFVGNAGIFDCFARLDDIPGELLGKAFDEIFEVNVKGTMLGVKAALPHIKETKGNIILTLSNAANYPHGGGVLYTSTKHALVGFVRQLAFELAPHVRVNAVAPGGTTSVVAGPPSLKEWCAKRLMGDERSKSIAKRTPLGFAQEPADHAGCYVLLASEQGKAMTGTVMESDGGFGVRGMWPPQ